MANEFFHDIIGLNYQSLELYMSLNMIYTKNQLIISTLYFATYIIPSNSKRNLIINTTILRDKIKYLQKVTICSLMNGKSKFDRSNIIFLCGNFYVPDLFLMVSSYCS